MHVRSSSHIYIYIYIYSYVYMYVHVKVGKYDYVNTQRMKKKFPTTSCQK